MIANIQTCHLLDELKKRGAVAIIWEGDDGETREELRRCETCDGEGYVAVERRGLGLTPIEERRLCPDCLDGYRPDEVAS